jgi:chorismate dehydratase
MGIVPGFGIACRGAVDSVKLFYRGDLNQLTRIWTDRGSHTSVALLRVLLRERNDVEPDYREIKPSLDIALAEGEGVLVIGDLCLQFEGFWTGSGERRGQSMDLGRAWWDLTGLPFVFAVWAASVEFLARADGTEIASLVRILAQAGENGLGRLDELAVREAARGALGHKGEATAAAVTYYFRESLRYRLGAEEMAGLARFRELCVKHGIVPEGPAPLILRG